MILLKKIIISGIVLVLAIGTYSQRSLFKCELISSSDYDLVEPNIYFDPDISNAQRQQILTDIKQAKNRINSTFGKTSAEPTIIVSGTEKKAASFGSNSTGSTRGGISGDFVLIGPRGQNVDVIAHELVHAELFHRTSFLSQNIRIPVWFLEGLSLLVDHRSVFLLENITLAEEDIKAVKQIFYASDFPSNNTSFYQAARVAIKDIDPKKLYKKLELINSGISFEQVYDSLQ